MNHASDLLARKEAKPAGEHLARLRKLAAAADAREGTDISRLSHEERLRLAMGR